MDQVAKSDLEIEIELFHQPAIDSARRMIRWAGSMYLLLPILLFAILARLTGPKILLTPAFALMFGVGLAIFAAHFALAWWAKRAPLPATLTALGVFITYNVVLAHYGTGSGLGAIVGCFILGRGVLAGFRVHKLRTTATAT